MAESTKSNARHEVPPKPTVDDRLRAEPTFAESALAEAARRTADHFAAKDVARERTVSDPIELWGSRIGRALSLAACIGLGIYLYLTYLR